MGYYLFDVAQACFTIVMLEDGGMPVSGTPVEGLNRQEFLDLMVQGYESEGLKVDRERLLRMIDIKKQLCIKFAKQA